MSIVYHDVYMPAFAQPPLVINITGERLSVAEGYWPDFGSFAYAPSTEIALEDDACAVLIRRTGQQACEIIASASVLPYGVQPLGGGRFIMLEYVDLLAWREADGWHVKHLVQGGG